MAGEGVALQGQKGALGQDPSRLRMRGRVGPVLGGASLAGGGARTATSLQGRAGLGLGYPGTPWLAPDTAAVGPDTCSSCIPGGEGRGPVGQGPPDLPAGGPRGAEPKGSRH